MFTALLLRLLKMTSFTPHPIRKLSTRTGGGLRDDALELFRRKDPDLCWRTDGRLLSRFRAAQRRNRYVYNRSASLLKMNIFRPLLRRKRSAQTGRGHQDDRRELAVARTSSSRRLHRCRFARPQIPQLSHLKVVYPPANLGASCTNFQSR